MTPHQIIAMVAEAHGLTPADLTGPSHLRKRAWARQEAWWVLRQVTPLSLAGIGALFGRTHGSVQKALPNVEHRIRHYPETLARVAGFIAKARKQEAAE